MAHTPVIVNNQLIADPQLAAIIAVGIESILTGGGHLHVAGELVTVIITGMG